jgi:prophage antirepressor-like protein
VSSVKGAFLVLSDAAKAMGLKANKGKTKFVLSKKRTYNTRLRQRLEAVTLTQYRSINIWLNSDN